MQLELAEVDFKAFALQQNSPGGRKDFAAFVDVQSVDEDRNVIAGAYALHARPFAERTFDVLAAARVAQLLEIPMVPRPPKLSARRWKSLRLAARLPAMSLAAGRLLDFGRDLHGNRLSAGVLPTNN